MKIRLLATICLLSIVLTLPAVKPEAVYQQMEKSYNTMYSWTAEVSQTNYYSQLKKTITFTGNIYYEPEKLVVQFSKPYLQRLQIIGNNVLLYDAQSKTALKTRPLPQFGRMNPVEILHHYWKLSKVTVTAETKESYEVSLVPDKDRLIKSLTAKINRKNGYVTELSYRDSGGNTNSYKFTKIKVNASIPARTWKFDLPKDTQIIDQ